MQSHLLILGHGYCSQHFLALHGKTFARVTVTTRSADKASVFERSGLDVHLLQAPEDTISSALAQEIINITHLLVCAPPDSSGDAVLSLVKPYLAQADHLSVIIYLSTTGVYGDHQGRWVNETTLVAPTGSRGMNRVLAEQQWQTFATSRSVPLWRFRLAGIYGPTRNALYQLRAGTARYVVKEGQVFNRIHVIDVARAIKAAFDAPALAAVLNICDDEPAPPQDVIAFAAELLKIPPPQSIPLAQAYPSPPGRSFFDDNKRVSNELMKQVLHVELSYSSYRIGLRALLDS